ncbi:hypothetical protein AG1IA_02845 [Rhizoctonia solani AG-1 IA]|uniref:Uncharacterized protein n=1 Tax=Thanatephorus cucumeris (strain AG1-IA) TaxID=983506 RepID=L8X3B1_THACA|nr:hypothetical protein AG1IA_02845 [Rhizoctonia solani AG-1 IA]
MSFLRMSLMAHPTPLPWPPHVPSPRSRLAEYSILSVSLDSTFIEHAFHRSSSLDSLPPTFVPLVRFVPILSPTPFLTLSKILYMSFMCKRNARPDELVSEWQVDRFARSMILLCVEDT